MNFDTLKKHFNHAFAVSDGYDSVTDKDRALITKLADFVVKRKMSTPAIMFLSVTKPLNFIGSSIMTFFKPTLGVLLNRYEYDRLEKLLEKRCSIELLINRIEELENNFKSGKVEKCRKLMSS
jgi:hypothetical protein